MVVALLGGSSVVAGQVVRGTLVDELSGEPLAAGFVLLLDSGGTEITRELTDVHGRFTLRAPAEGTYRLRAVVVGRRSWDSQPMWIATGEPREERVAMPSVPVRLPALLVQADRDCRVRPEQGEAAAVLWEEARKVLQVVAWTDREGSLQHRLALYTRQVDPRTLRVLEQRTESRQGMARGSPFVTLDPERLLSEGFIRSNPGGGWTYDAPDASVLLSAPFADLHCFSVRATGSDEPDGLIGLAFEPVRDRSVSDVEGVLWLDAVSAELRYLEFGYTRIPWQLESPLIGGRVDFVRLPNGVWIVDRWAIRMPETELLVGAQAPTRASLRGIREVGGWVDEVRTRDGELVRRVASARLRGEIKGPNGRGLEGAALRILGTAFRAEADRSGHFQFDSLPAGEHLIVYEHPDLPVGDLPMPPYTVHLRPADTASVAVTVPTAGDLLGAYCPDVATDERRGVLGGLVLSPEGGTPMRGVRVVAAWQEWQRANERGLAGQELEVSAASDRTGFYVLCNVPVGARLRVWAATDGWQGAEVDLSVGPARTRRQDLAGPPGGR